MPSEKEPVEFIDTSADVIKALQRLSKSALRASGKVISEKLRQEIKQKHVHSARFQNHVGYWAFVDRNTGQPQLWTGFYSRQRVNKKKPGGASHANPHWIEFGTAPHTIKAGVRSSRGTVYRKTKEKFLCFNGNVAVKKVKHPGQNANHILRDTVLHNIDEIEQAQVKYLKKLSDKLDDALRAADKTDGTEEND